MLWLYRQQFGRRTHWCYSDKYCERRLADCYLVINGEEVVFWIKFSVNDARFYLVSTYYKCLLLYMEAGVGRCTGLCAGDQSCLRVQADRPSGICSGAGKKCPKSTCSVNGDCSLFPSCTLCRLHLLLPNQYHQDQSIANDVLNKRYLCFIT